MQVEMPPQCTGLINSHRKFSIEHLILQKLNIVIINILRINLYIMYNPNYI